MDLYCISESSFGFIGSSFIGGCFVGSFILPRLADIVGRKPMFMLGLTIFVAVVVASLFTTNIHVAYFLLFMGGISETGRYYVAYVYLIEFVPARYQNNAGLYIFMVFGVVMTYIAMQFWFIVKYWQVNAAWALLLATSSFVATILWMPESPRYYYSRRKFQEAALAMKKIARVNLGRDYDFVFKAAGVEELGPIDTPQTSEYVSFNNEEETPGESVNTSVMPESDFQTAEGERESRGSFAPSPDEVKEARNELKLTGSLKELFRISIYRRNLMFMVVIWSFCTFSFFVVPYYLDT